MANQIKRKAQRKLPNSEPKETITVTKVERSKRGYFVNFAKHLKLFWEVPTRGIRGFSRISEDDTSIGGAMLSAGVLFCYLPFVMISLVVLPVIGCEVVEKVVEASE
jgi:hypothetical protein